MIKRLISRLTSIQTFKFIIVGILNTVVGYGVYFICIHLGIKYQISLILSSIVGVTHSFFWNKYWTFKAKGYVNKEIVRFISVYMISYIINALMLSFFVENIKIDQNLAQIYAISIITLISYIGHKYWSFSK